MTELKMKEMQLINWFGCPNLIYTRERIHLVAMLTTDEEMKKNLYRVCRFLAREEIAYRYPIMYEMIRKIFSPDDATNATLTAYLAGAFGTAGDKVADDFCIRQLLPNKLKDQYCFKTEAAIECLKFVKGEKIWLK